jgi:hypothetical protein
LIVALLIHVHLHIHSCITFVSVAMHVALEGNGSLLPTRQVPTPGSPYLAPWPKYKHAKLGTYSSNRSITEIICVGHFD